METTLYKKTEDGTIRSYWIGVMLQNPKNGTDIQEYSIDSILRHPDYIVVKVTRSGAIDGNKQEHVSELKLTKTILNKIKRARDEDDDDESTNDVPFNKQAAKILDEYLADAFSREVEKKIKADEFVRSKREAELQSSLRPMLLSVYKPGKIKPDDFAKYWIQPKIDGERCVARYNSALGEFEFWSRKNELFIGLDHLSAELKSFTEFVDPNIYIDGELYIPNFDLQKITSIVHRRVNLSKADMKQKRRVKYIVFDLVNLNERHEPFINRWEHLSLSFREHSNGIESVELVKLYNPVQTADELEKLHTKIVRQGYEGIVLRRDNGRYRFGRRGLKDIMKKKFRLEGDYKIIGFTGESRGKYKDAIIWICETKNKNGIIKPFRVVPEGVTKADRIRAFREADQDFSRFNGRLLQVNYYDTTADNIPKFANSSLYPKLR